MLGAVVAASSALGLSAADAVAAPAVQFLTSVGEHFVRVPVEVSVASTAPGGRADRGGQQRDVPDLQHRVRCAHAVSALRLASSGCSSR
jgi:hypothetical protein